ALILTPGYFTLYSLSTLLALALLGYLEATGVLHTIYSARTDAVRVFDLVAIFAVTAVPIRLLAGSFKKNLLQIRKHEAEIRTKAEQLRDSEERFRTLFESQGEGTGIVDIEERFLLCNPAAEAILGVPAGGLIGRSLKEFVTPDEWDKVLSQTASRRGGNRSTYEMDVIRTDGKKRSIIVTATPQFQSGSYAGAIGVFRDITDQKDLQNELMQSQRIQSLGTLAGGIAHDFNNILGIILGYASKMDRSGMGTDEWREGLAAVKGAVARGASLVQQILTFARRTDIASKPLSVPDLVKELVTMLRRTFPGIVSFRIESSGEIPIIVADQTQVHQALLNLCVNARDAMPSGGEILIRMQTLLREDLQAKFTGVGGNRYVCISVKDAGIGMDDETKGRAFDPFFTTKEKGKGTGLGLSVVYGIIKNHHGFVEVESTPGAGSTFSLFLPVPDQKLHLDDAAETPESVPGGTETILVVEDEQILQNLVCDWLRDAGYRVIAAADGAEAVETLMLRKGTIAAVFTDMGLPKLTGLELVRKLRRVDPTVRIIAAGGFLEPEMKTMLLQEGVGAVVQKPYEPDKILVLIRRILDAD
ncbi:MAG TPA: ATP-binding protein, partial [Bacteroidota bacterium]|nr:ATP-binding protein [Bacteroidota bacterium]